MKKKTKQFIALSSETLNGKLILLQTSDNETLYDVDGISFDRAIEFIHNLYKKRNNKTGIVFVCYGFNRDNEFIFSTLDKTLKDKLFQSYNIRAKISEYEKGIEDAESVLYTGDKDSQEFQQADFDKYVNKLAIADLQEVKHKGYKISLINGKKLTISKDKKSITVYDIFGFFKPSSLRQAVNTWLGKDIVLLDKENFCYIDALKNNLPEQLKQHCALEVSIIAELATKLNTELTQCGITLRSYHGASAVTNWLLNQTKAKSNFNNYKRRFQLSNELYKAVYQSFYAGRAEQFKIGTLKDVKIYDINSAYAYASTFLPVFKRKPYFVSSWNQQPFSVWFVEFDFSSLPTYFGYLPNRDFSNLTRYKLKGKGYFWQPEISYILEHHPESIKVKYGFCTDYQLAPFTKGIELLYELRLQLQANNNPLEKIIKLALSSIYGKFCQHNGQTPYFNMFYAGFITSLTRRKLLEATKGNEQETICFLTDAIHTTANLEVSVSNNLGEYKLTTYDKVTYLDNGIYRCYKRGEVIKTKTKGFRNFNFDLALENLTNTHQYDALAEFFIGHNLHSLQQFSNASYLEDCKLDKKFNPLESAQRLFDSFDCDLTKNFLDSKPVSLYNGAESGLYKLSENKEKDYNRDTILAGRI